MNIKSTKLFVINNDLADAKWFSEDLKEHPLYSNECPNYTIEGDRVVVEDHFEYYAFPIKDLLPIKRHTLGAEQVIQVSDPVTYLKQII